MAVPKLTSSLTPLASAPMTRPILVALLASALLLGACATPEQDGPAAGAPAADGPGTGVPVGAAEGDAPAASGPAAAAGARDGWHPVLLPGKEATDYRWALHDGRTALAARSTRSASLWRRKMSLAAEQVGPVRFGWWVDGVIEGASVADAMREDAPARVIFAFAGDESKLPQRTRMLYDLAEAMTGERPPYATLMYVYETGAPVGSVIHGPRSDRVRKIVLDSGPGHLRQWRDHRRDLRDDFRTAFGEEPGPLVAVALMTDSDNTGSRATTWYTLPRFD